MSFIQANNLPFGFAVQRGNVPNFSAINKFGYNSAVGTSYETIWDGNNAYTYVSSAGTATVTSSDTSSDNDSVVEIQGLDANYNLQTVDATVGGSATIVADGIEPGKNPGNESEQGTGSKSIDVVTRTEIPGHGE